MRNSALVPLLGLLACLALPPAVSAAPTGTAMGVDPDATAKTASATRTLVVGTDIFIGDVVATGPSGQVQILFSDRTELVVGPRSSLTIEDYLLRENGSAGKLAVNALAGTFRFVTGNAPKDRYLIKTPTGTIGVRGTAFDFTVTRALTSILLHHGAVIACTLDGECVTLDDVCEVGQYDLGEAVVIGNTDTIRGEARETLKRMFTYSVNQLPLLREFRISQAERCLRREPPGGGPGSLIVPGPGGQPGGNRQTPPNNSIKTGG